MKLLRMFLIIFVVVFNGGVYAEDKIEEDIIELEVDWQSQVDLVAGLGTSLNKSMACGPTSLVMAVSSIKEFCASPQAVKDTIDWLYNNGRIPVINNYDLAKKRCQVLYFDVLGLNS